jgi:CHAT domain
MDLPVPDTVPIQLRSEESALLKRKREYQAESSWERAENESLRLNRLREIAANLNACWQKMEPHAPAYVKLRRAESARLEDVRAILRDNTAGSPTALVSAFVDEKGLIWFVQRSDSQEVQVFHAPLGSSALLAAAKGLRRTFNGAPSEFPPYPPIRRTEPGNRTLEFFEKLSGDILSFLPGIKGVEHICIAPHGPLHLLPLHALRTEEGHYLAEEFAVTYAPSLSSLRYCIARRTPSHAHVSGGSVYCAGVASREDARKALATLLQETETANVSPAEVELSDAQADRAARETLALLLNDPAIAAKVLVLVEDEPADSQLSVELAASGAIVLGVLITWLQTKVDLKVRRKGGSVDFEFNMRKDAASSKLITMVADAVKKALFSSVNSLAAPERPPKGLFVGRSQARELRTAGHDARRLRWPEEDVTPIGGALRPQRYCPESLSGLPTQERRPKRRYGRYHCQLESKDRLGCCRWLHSQRAINRQVTHRVDCPSSPTE